MIGNPNRQLIIGLAVIVGISLVCCVVIGAAAVMVVPRLVERTLDEGALSVGSPAPDFELTSLEGETVRLSQFQGKPVLLSFGATWCPGCRAEAPRVQELHVEHPELVILLVDIEESASVVQRFADQVGITHPILLDRTGRVSRTYLIQYIPSSFFIDPDGILRAILVEELDSRSLAKYLPSIGVTP